MSKSIAELIASLQKELAQLQKDIDERSAARRETERAEFAAMNRRAQIAREIEELQEVQKRLSGV